MRVETPLDQIFFCTVRIEAILKEDTICGTGFLYSIPQENSSIVPFLVTNKHVIRGATTGRFWFHRNQNGAPDLRSPIHVELQNFENRFFYHPDPKVDIAVMPLVGVIMELQASGVDPFMIHIEPSILPDTKALQDLDAVEEIVFVGYPIGIYDSFNYLPIVRRGHTATPVQIDYQGEQAFLIDAAVFPGSSGSPVFIISMNSYRRGNTIAIGDSRIFFLGVITSGHTWDQIGRIVQAPVPTSDPRLAVSQMINLGIVAKYSAVDEACRLCLQFNNR